MQSFDGSCEHLGLRSVVGVPIDNHEGGTVSHHLDSPTSRRDSRLNITDLYAFDGDDATVLTMLVNTSLAGAERTPGFHPGGPLRVQGPPRRCCGRGTLLPLLVRAGRRVGTQPVVIDRLDGADARDDSADRHPRRGGGHRRDDQRRRPTGVGRCRGRPVLPRPASPGAPTRRTAERAADQQRRVDSGPGGEHLHRLADLRRSSSRSRHSDAELGRAAGSACGPAPSSPPTPAVGARSTELASR